MSVVKILHSVTAGNVPALPGIGQIAINEADRLLFYRDSSGTVHSFNLQAAGAVALLVPLTGTTVTIAALNVRTFLNPAGTLATLTIALPPSPVNLQTHYVHATQNLTVLTLSGGTIKNPPTTLAPGASIGYMFLTSAAAWFRIQ